MKNYIAGFLLALGIASAHAQTPAPTPVWNLTPVNGENSKPVGYIFHTYATGTRYTTPPTKSVTGLRLICTLKGNADPVIAIYWDNTKQTDTTNVQFRIKVDGKEVEQDDIWMQEGKLTYRTIKDSPQLLKAMKTGHRIQFDWFDADASRRVTMFSLITFNLYLNDFNSACHTQL